MILNLDLPVDKWQFLKTKLQPHKKDSETITLICNAIESLTFKESWSQKIFQCLTANGKNPFKFPSTHELGDCNLGHGLIKQVKLAGIKWKTLEKQYYQFLLDHYNIEVK